MFSGDKCLNLLKRYFSYQSNQPEIKRMKIDKDGDNQKVRPEKMKITIEKSPNQSTNVPTDKVTTNSKTENGTDSRETNGKHAENQENGIGKTREDTSEVDQEESIDLTDKIKCEEMKLSNQSVRFQIFVPEVHDVEFKLMDKHLKVKFASKDKKFNKTYDSKSCQFYHIFINGSSDAVDADTLIVHGKKRKSFEVQYSFKKGKAPLPAPPSPPAAPTPPPLGPTNSKSIKTKTSSNSASSSSEKISGYTGLINVGNTCFMASVIQCLANVPQLRDYFRDGNYVNDINKDNVLGTGGDMANAFHFLLEQMWSGKHTAVKPSRVKDVVGERAPQFQGYSQHDAQEFCAYILDLLHEDVNQVKKKPYVEIKEADGRPDSEVAKESWDGFCSRNQSKIVDLFYGQYKSTLDCPLCKKKSITFDPYVYLSVPMPRETRKLRVLFFYPFSHDEIERPRRLEITVSKSGGTLAEILQQAARLTNTKAENIRILREYKSGIQEVLADRKTSLDDIQATDSIVLCDVGDFNQETERIIGINFKKELPDEGLTKASKCKTCEVEDGSIRTDPETGEEKKVKLERCAKCRMVWYCGKECQQQNWPYHKPNCHKSTVGVGLPVFIRVRKVTDRETLVYTIKNASRFTIDYKWDDDSISHNKESNTVPEPFTIDPFNMMATLQSMKLKEIKDSWNDNAIDLTDVDYLLITWKNDPFKGRGKVPFLSKVETIDLDDLECDNVNSLEETTVTLDRCIQMFSESEILEKSEYWYCSTCKDHVAAQKQISLWKLPRILVFHIKRFQYKASQYFAHSVRRDKINKYVDYDTNGLDMGPYCLDPKIACEGKEPIYDLIGVVNHMGSMSYGHYTAAVRHPDKPEQWRKADDSHVRDIDEKQAKSEYAYLLFYQLREEHQTVATISEEDLEKDMEELRLDTEGGDREEIDSNSSPSNNIDLDEKESLL